MKRWVSVLVATVVAGAVSCVPAAGVHAQESTARDSGEAPTARATAKSRIAASKRVDRNAVVEVRKVKGKKKVKYRVVVTNHIGWSYVKWTMASGAWGSYREQVDGSASYPVAERVKKLTVRAAGYKNQTIRMKKPVGRFKLQPNGVIFAWETEGDPSSYDYSYGQSQPIPWDPCTYEYSGASGFVNVTATHQTKHSLTWSMQSRDFDESLLNEALARMSKESGWGFQRVATGGDFVISIESVDSGHRVEGSAMWHWFNDLYMTSGSIEARLGSLAPRRQKVRLLMHEIGHVLGLQDVDDESQLMNSEILFEAQPKTGAGDRAGLARLAPNNGCVYRIGDSVWL